MRIGKKAEQIVNFGYKLGMSQERYEILALTEYLMSRRLNNIMEIGTKYGGVFYILSSISRGIKISVDKKGGSFGGWALNNHPYFGDVISSRNDFFCNRFDPKVHFILRDSHLKSTENIVKNLLYDYSKFKEDSLDLLFIDGDHTYKGVKQDYEMYSKYVRKGGLIVFHDINDTDYHKRIGCDVSLLWRELGGKKIEFNNHAHWCGIGVLEK